MGTGLLSPTHLIFLAILALLLFGAKRLPEMARSLGTGLHEFKSSVTGPESHSENGNHTPTPLTARTEAKPIAPVTERDTSKAATTA